MVTEESTTIQKQSAPSFEANTEQERSSAGVRLYGEFSISRWSIQINLEILLLRLT